AGVPVLTRRATKKTRACRSQVASLAAMKTLSRRDLLKNSGTGLIAASIASLGAAPAAVAAASKAAAAKQQPEGALAPLNRFGRMMQEYYVTRLREFEKTGATRRAALRTRADAEGYVREV